VHSDTGKAYVYAPCRCFAGGKGIGLAVAGAEALAGDLPGFAGDERSKILEGTAQLNSQGTWIIVACR